LIIYFDTSALLPLVIEEPGSLIASRLWDDAEHVVSSRLTYAEGRAAMAMALRMKRLDEQDLRSAVDAFEVIHDQLQLVEVTDALVRRAGVLAEEFALRGYDSVHLASVEEIASEDVVLAAGDRSLLSAAEDLGIAVAYLR
jgi:predicted nucleic acid-binding protein